MKKEKLLNLERICTKLFSQILLIFLIIIATGCGKSDFNEKIFTKTVEKNNFITTKIDKQTIAISDHYQMVLTEFKNNKECEKEYKKLLKKYEKAKKKENYFYIKNDNVYTIVYKVENYYIECSAPKTYEKEINKVIKEMNLEL